MSLDERYGRRPPNPVRRRRLLAAGVALFVVVAGLWAAWAAVRMTSSSLTWSLARADASDPAAVRVSFVVSLAPGTRAVCAVRATDPTGAVVGWLDVPVDAPEGDGTLVRVPRTATVPTSQPATNGGVSDCARR